jgi:alkylation response protein AidB-like acyl-CoA dehydrogenase
VTESSSHPLVAAAAKLAGELLEPSAADVDANGVPRSHLEAIAAAGLLGVVAPKSAGGADAGSAVLRAVAEHLAGADAATWFVQAQHHTPVRLLSANPSAAADRYLPRLATGRLVAGVALAQLRRFPRCPVTATPTGTGWRLDGTAPWYTGWGLNDVAVVGAVTEGDDVVVAILPAREGGGLRVKSRVRTAALDAACTVALSFNGVRIEQADVVLVQPCAEWLAADRVVSANASSAIFGIGQGALRLLAESGAARGEPVAGTAAAVLGRRLDDVRTRAYRLADEPPAEEVIAARLATRAEALRLLIDITTALVAASSGPGMARTSAAQRKAREALFMLVQGQTAAGRAAMLQHYT